MKLNTLFWKEEKYKTLSNLYEAELLCVNFYLKELITGDLTLSW